MTPFIIGGMPRTGSTLLTLGLGQHPDVQVYGELFHPVAAERHGSHAIPAKDGGRISFDEAKDDAIAFVKAHVFSNPSIGAAGFKLFGSHVQCAGTERIFARLKDEIEGLKVVHIIRSNYLDVLVSERMAKATGQWQRKPSEPAPQYDPARIEPERVLRFFEAMRNADATFRNVFAGSYCAVHYADLSLHFKQHMSRVFEFLGVRKFDVAPKIEKQIRTPARDLIANYDEIRKAVSGTPYESMVH